MASEEEEPGEDLHATILTPIDASARTVTASVDDYGEGRRDSNLWMSMGIHKPEDGSARKRRMSKRFDSMDKNTAEKLQDLAPGTRVMFLLQEKDDVPAVFTEMGELMRSGDTEEWRETARWVKFEEDVEEGGNRWSKPHVATLSLHSLFQLRSCLLNGAVLIDLDAETLPQVIDLLLDELIKTGQLGELDRDNVRQVLLRRHTHQYEQAGKTSNGNGSGQGGSFLNAVRSISDIGRSFSHGRNLARSAAEDETPKRAGAQLELPKVGSVPQELPREGSHADVSKGNTHFLKKLPPGVEASNVLIGEVDFLAHHITAFIRLKNASILGDLTEVPVPTRFLFFLLGPSGHSAQYREIGRAIATLMSDEIFHDVAYKARNRTDLLDGVDEFLDQVTVLPPGEWDPNIRIEPPTVIPSQHKRKLINSELLPKKDVEGGGHKDVEEEQTPPTWGGGAWKRSRAEEDRPLVWWPDSGHQAEAAVVR
uniref:Band_3_cyto domain-containing protein n=1 Tax=Steinernema glaseri TaxID=37863 RepID=A0A1I8ASN9_9BILA